MRFAQKLYYVFFAFFTVLFISMVFYVYWIQTRGIQNQLEQQFETLAEYLASSSQRLIRNMNYGILYGVLNKHVEDHDATDRLLYLRILDDNGVVFFSNTEAEEGKPSTFPADKNIFSGNSQISGALYTRIRESDMGKAYDISIPFDAFQNKYVLRAGFLLGAEVQLNTGIFLMLFTFLGLLVIIFVFVLSRIIIKPVEDLTQETHKIARGMQPEFLSARFRDDEIGDLARSLHHLLRELDIKRKQLAAQEKLAVLGKGAGRMTHNMSNLLNPVDHYFKIVETELRKSQATPQLHSALSNIEKHVNLVRKDLKHFRNVIPDQPYREKYPLDVLIQTALSRLIMPKNIKIAKNTDPSIQIWVDPEQMTDVLYNLLLNAAQAMPNGGQLWISTEDEKSSIVIRIQDTGIGIARENLRDIFQFFYSTKKDGMGIGLSSAAEIVRNHGGDITVESLDNKGTTFTIKMPKFKPPGKNT